MENLKPDIYKRSIFELPYKRLKEEKIRLLLLDLDNTVLPFGKQEVEPIMIDFLNQLKQDGFQIILFSNAFPTKVKRNAKLLGVDFIACALKPWKLNFQRVLKKYKCEPEEVAMIGDQLLTDIKGGNKIGMTTILVTPLINNDSFFTTINRIHEDHLMKKMGAKGYLFKGRYYE